jgi:hypothetical protein
MTVENFEANQKSPMDLLEKKAKIVIFFLERTVKNIHESKS